MQGCVEKLPWGQCAIELSLFVLVRKHCCAVIIFELDFLWGTICAPLCWGNNFRNGLCPCVMQAHLAVPDSLLRSAALCQWEQFLHEHFGRQQLRKKVCWSHWTLGKVLGDGLVSQRRKSHLTHSYSPSLLELFPLNPNRIQGKICHWTVTATVLPIHGVSPHLCPCDTCFSPLLSWLCGLMYTNYLFQEASLNNCKDIYFPGEIVELPHVFAVTFSFLTNLSVICLEAKFLQCLFHLLFKSNFLKALLHYLWTFTSSVSHDQICRIFSITSLIRKKN